MSAQTLPLVRCSQRNVGQVETTASSSRIHFVPVLSVALILRLVMAIVTISAHPGMWFYNQSSELGCLAHSVLDGRGLASPFCGVTGPSAFLAPGYPLLVAFAFHLFGEYTNSATVMLVLCQLVFGVLFVFALMALSRRIFGSQVANIAGAICAISPAMIWLPVLFWETSFTILSLTGILAFALHCVDSPKPLNWLTIGLFCGLAMLVNPAITFTLAAIVLWAAWQARSVPRFAPALALVTWLLVFSAWPIRNEIVFHKFIPLRTNLGYELWQGNHTGSDGAFDPTLHLNINRIERSRYAEIGELNYMREKSAIAMAAIKADPARFVRLSLQRANRFWFGFPSEQNSALVIANLSLTTIFGAAGLALLVYRKPSYALLLSAPFVLFPLPYYLTHADFRFRLVLDPLAIMLSVYAVQSLRTHLASRRISASI